MKDALRRVAGLFVEIETPSGSVGTAPGQTSATTPDYSKMSDADLLAALDAASSKTAPSKSAKTVEQVVKESPGPNLDEIKPVAEATPQPTVVSANGDVDFSAIYALAKLPNEPFTAENVIEVIAQLPAELPLEAKRATMKVTLGAMAKTSGASTASVISDASRKMAALDAYADSYSEQANQFVTLSEAEIARLEGQIAERKRAVEEAKSKSKRVREQCEAQINHLDDVLEFFTLDVPPSKHA